MVRERGVGLEEQIREGGVCRGERVVALKLVGDWRHAAAKLASAGRRGSIELASWYLTYCLRPHTKVEGN